MPSTTRDQRGVTFVELLTVVVIVGLLAVFALPRLSRNKEKTIIASMQSDMRNLALAEEGYYYANATYTSNPVVLNITLSQGNSLTINQATISGWSATISNPLTPQQCYLFHGTAAPLGTAVVEGDINCS
jgi:prepilin-type N-terminal cleavage/methylation domain-containing protein